MQHTKVAASFHRQEQFIWAIDTITAPVPSYKLSYKWFVIRLLLWHQNICQSAIQKLLDSLEPTHRTKIAKFQEHSHWCYLHKAGIQFHSLAGLWAWARTAAGSGCPSRAPSSRPPSSGAPHRTARTRSPLHAIHAHCIKATTNQPRESRWRSGCPYPRRRRAPCRQLRGNATRQSPPEWTSKVVNNRQS
jgi:hypothetical protein